MLKQKKYNKRYNALGFVEALLAIIVAGIASVLLMGVAIDTVKQLVKTDQQDEMTQLAISGGEIIKNIAHRNSYSDSELFPAISGNQNSCYEFDNSGTNPAFVTDISGNITAKCNYDAGGRAQCKENSNLGNDYFRVFCISSGSDVQSGLVVGKIIVGKKVCESNQECDVPDYSYYILTKTEQ